MGITKPKTMKLYRDPAPKRKPPKVKLDEVPVNSKGTKHGGPRPGGGRRMGSINKFTHELKAAAALLIPVGVQRLGEIIGASPGPELDKNNKPIMIQQFEQTGKPVLDDDGNPVFYAKMVPGKRSPSDQAVIAATSLLFDRVAGRVATADPKDSKPPLIPIRGIELVEVPVGTPLNNNEPEPEEDE